MGFIIRKSIFYDMMDGNQLNYEFDNRDLDHVTFKGDGKESFSFGKLKAQEWNNMFAKHLNHHLEQFGV